MQGKSNVDSKINKPKLNAPQVKGPNTQVNKPMTGVKTNAPKVNTEQKPDLKEIMLKRE